MRARDSTNTCSRVSAPSSELGPRPIVSPAREMKAATGAIRARPLSCDRSAWITALRARDPEGGALARYTEVAGILTGQAGAAAEDGAAWLSNLVRELGIPGLAAYGMSAEDCSAVVAKAANASSMKANPIVLTEGELAQVFCESLK